MTTKRVRGRLMRHLVDVDVDYYDVFLPYPEDQPRKYGLLRSLVNRVFAIKPRPFSGRCTVSPIARIELETFGAHYLETEDGRTLKVKITRIDKPTGVPFEMATGDVFFDCL